MENTHSEKIISTDFLVIGSGMAGLMLALKLAELGSVILLSKETLAVSNSYFAQGGIASVRSVLDSFSAHSADTISAGAGLCHADIVALTVASAPEVIADLLAYGVEFTRDEQTLEEGGSFHLTQEGGHSFRRIFHHKDTTGRAIVEALSARVREHPGIKILEQQYVVDLLQETTSGERGTCIGAEILDRRDHHLYPIYSATTFLCTGGHGRIYRYTSNPPGATGDGLAIAWRAGCRVANLEFMQFHPSCLYHPQAGNFLISEALRGEGGILMDAAGRSFMEEYSPLGSLAPRDIVARAIHRELKKSGQPCVYLDLRHLGAAKIKDLFPGIYQRCLEFKVDITQQPIPVVPAAHYSCGGIVVDSWGQTDIAELYAVGEVACTGLHGGNRLASNSLLEAGVFARRAAEKVRMMGVRCCPHSCHPEGRSPRRTPQAAEVLRCAQDDGAWWDEIRQLMWDELGIVRTVKGMTQALRRMQEIRSHIAAKNLGNICSSSFLEVRNLADVAWLTIRAALLRQESRGCHFVEDFPEHGEKAADTIIGF